MHRGDPVSPAVEGARLQLSGLPELEREEGEKEGSGRLVPISDLLSAYHSLGSLF